MAHGQAFKDDPLALGQAVGVAQPEVARTDQQFVVLPLGAPHLINGIVDDLDGMELVEGDDALGRLPAVPLMNAGLMSMQTSATASGSPPCAVRSSANAATVSAS